MTNKHKDTGLELLVRDFLVTKQVEGRSPATISFYEQNLRRFLWWLGTESISSKIDDIDVRLLRAFLFYVQTTPVRWLMGSKSSERLPSIVTVDAYWRTLQAFFSWLIREGTIDADSNPMKKLSRPKLPKKIVQDIPLELIQQALDMWDAETLIGARNRAIILL